MSIFLYLGGLVTTMPNSAKCDVLHVTTAFGGGVETVLRTYVEATPDLQHRALVRKRAGHEVSGFNSFEVQALSGSFWDYLRRVSEVVAELDPRVVHIHSSAAGLLRMLPRRRHTRYVYQPHCYAFERTDYPRLVRAGIAAIERHLSRRTDVVVAVSPHEKHLARTLDPRSHVIYVPNVATVEDSRNGATRSEGYDRPPRIVTVGRISAQKDPAYFSAVIRSLRDLEAIVTWVGDGTQEQRKTLERLGVRVTGWLPHPEVLDTVKRHDLYLHTAAWEGAPLAIIEAAAVGLPVLARPIAAIMSLGFPVSEDSPEALADAVRRHFVDPDFQEENRKLTREALGQLNYDAMHDSLRQVYFE